MIQLRSTVFSCLAAVAGMTCTAGIERVDAAESEPVTGALPETNIRHLHYGDVLFHFFQDDYFEALVRLEVASDYARMPSHAEEAELLSGGLYLSLGLPAEAARIFQDLLDENIPVLVRDRAYFYLARISYQRGFYDEARVSLQKITAPLLDGLEPERKLLEANVLMAEQRFDEAAEVLRAWDDDSLLASYARFNLGVALLRSGRTGQGSDLLDTVGRTPPVDEEQWSLKDRANLALGFELLQQGDGAGAVTVLERVRLNGPFTSRALLGLGWAESEQQSYRRALVPWLELRDRRLLDAAVQESYLAVPYAYARLAADGQAADRYREAVVSYSAESARIDESIAAIRGGGFLAAVLEQSPDEEASWFWQLENLADAPETRYLYHLLATHAFQEGLKNYRDLHVMQANLERWKVSLEAFDDMIELRGLAAAERAPRKQEVLEATDLAAFERRQSELEQRLAAIGAERDIEALASAEEAARLAILDDVEARLAALPSGARRDALEERARLLRGTLIWQLDADYKRRLRSAQRGLRESGKALDEARDRLARVPEAAGDAARGTDDFARRRQALARRIDELVPRLQAASIAQERVLADLAVDALQAQKRRLASYAAQAQFALAALYDSAALGASR